MGRLAHTFGGVVCYCHTQRPATPAARAKGEATMLRITITGLSTIPFRGVLPVDEALRTVEAVAGAPGVTIKIEPAD